MSLLTRHPPVATVAFNMRPVAGPWGGSSAFVAQMSAYLRRRGYAVRYDLRRAVDAIVLVDPRQDNPAKKFGPDGIRAYLQSHPQTAVLHRVNECDQRKATNFMDRLLADANPLADYTVFISEWLREYHAARWFDSSRRHRAIYNGADPTVFHPYGGEIYCGSGPLRVVTHHWADNPLKGFDVYAAVDEALADGRLKGFEFWVIGRWPKDLRWKASRTFAPASGKTLADLLRSCHLYLTASRWEPCGMHHVEGAQCGLPLVYHEDGGGIVEAGRKYGVGFRDDVGTALQVARTNYAALRAKVLAQVPDGERMCWEYEGVLRETILRKQGLLST